MARLLHDFNTEYHEPVPEVGLLARRVADFIERDDDFQATFIPFERRGRHGRAARSR